MVHKVRKIIVSLRSRLIILVLIAILPISGLNIYRSYANLLEHHKQAKRELQNLVQLLSAEQQQWITNAKLVITTLIHIPDIRPNQAEQCHELLVGILAINPSFSNIGVADRQGNVYCSTISQAGTINIADRDYFRQAIENKNFSVSGYQTGRITLKPGINIAYPLIQGDEIIGVVYVVLNLNWLAQTSTQLNIPTGSSLTIIDKNGIVLLRIPSNDNWIGKTAPENSIFSSILGSKDIGISEGTGLDGIKREYAYSPLIENGNLFAYIILGVPTSELYDEAIQEQQVNLLILAILIVAIFFIALQGGEYLITKRIYELLGVIHRFSKGDLTTRSRVRNEEDELNQLMISFNEMADEIQRNLQALEQAKERYRTLVENIPAIVYEAAVDNIRTPLFVNSLIEKITGFTFAEWLTEPELWFKQIYPEDKEKVIQAIQTLGDDSLEYKQEYRLFTKDGRVVWIYEDAHRINLLDGTTRWQGVMIDITSQKRLAEERNLLEILAKELLNINDFSNALEYTLQVLCEKANWDYGEIWLPNPDENLLTFGLMWARKEEHKQFADLSRLYTFKYGEGLPGKAWQMRQAIWENELFNQEKFVRAEHVHRFGFQSAIVYPVFADDKLLAVYGFFTREINIENEEKIPLINGVLNQLSSYFMRKQAEEAFHRQYEILKSLYQSAQLMSETLVPMEVAHQITRFCVESFGVNLAWLGKSEEDGSVSVIAHYPLDNHYPTQIKVRWDDTPESKGPTGRAIKEKRIIIADLMREPDYAPWRKKAMDEQGFCCSAAFPLVSQGQTFGALNLYSNQINFFNDERLNMFQMFANQAATALENAKLLEETQHLLEITQALRRIDMAITGSLDLRVTFNVALDEITTQLKIDAACILLLNPDTYTLKYAAGRGFHTRALEYTRLNIGQGLAGKAAQDRQIIYVNNLIENHTDFQRSPFFAREGFVSYYAVPLIAKGKINGVLEIFHRSPLPDLINHGKKKDGWINFLETLAGQVAIAIDNASMFINLENANRSLIKAYDATIEGWSYALDLRDKETEGHTKRVTELTVRLAMKMGIHGDELNDIRRGALLHDIGKMGVPDNILLKPGSLTEDEWVVMRKHPQYAFDMLSTIKYLKNALDIPYCHHEKWDGSGYPRGLIRYQIPLAARIFAIADVYDALTSDRPYRKAWSKEKTIEYILDQSGKHFDPDVVKTFLELMTEGGLPS